MPRTGSPGIASLDLEFLPGERSVHHVRVLSHSIALLLGHDSGMAARVMVSCAELTDALARRVFTGACHLRLRSDVSASLVTIELSGSPPPELTLSLERAVQMVNRGSPVDAYTAALAAGPEQDPALLSLARIRYEGQLRLSYERDGARCTVRASAA